MEEIQVKKYLERWATVVLALKPVLMWEQSWHPLAIACSVSAFYLILYLMDLNALTTFAVLGLILNTLDFIVPSLTKLLYGPNLWNGQMEKAFEGICNGLVQKYNHWQAEIQQFYLLRDEHPVLCYGISCPVLLTLVWLSLSVNNIFLFYLLTIAVMLWPGFQSNGGFKLFTTKTVKTE